MTRTIVIVDDHEDFRAAARSMLAAQGFSVVGEAADGGAAVRLAHELRPAVVLLDIALPDIDGFEVARRLAASSHPPIVVLVSSRDRDSFGSRLDGAPVRGFLAKHELSGAALGRLLG